MADAQLWAMTHSQRRDLADFLDDLTPEQWRAQSLCGGWLVREVVAHMVSTARMTPGKFFRGMAAARFRFDAFSARNLAAYKDRTTQELLAEVRETAGRTTG